MPRPAFADDVLLLVPYFRGLRPDERVRIARLLQTTRLAPGETFALEALAPKLVIVAEGALDLSSESGGKSILFPGDSLGDHEVVAGQGKTGLLTAREPSVVATLDHAALETIFERVPVVAVQFVAELGRELKWRNDLLREVCLARAEGLPPARLEGVLRRRRRMLRRKRQSSLRKLGALVWRLVVSEPARLPSFWMFAGAVLALVAARAVVAFIIGHGLQKHLFALIGGSAGHPIHIHHFNYGLLLVSSIGLVSMLPRVRSYLRALSFVFGFGLGLVVDEFALLWNLNPDYYQASSRLAAALVLFALAQVVYFRAMYASLWRRLTARVLRMSVRTALRAVEWLSSLSDPELDGLAAKAQQRVFAPGEALVTELEVGDDLFVLLEGTARATVVVGAGGSRRAVGALGPGAACGEASLLTRELRSATVTAETRVVALRLTRRNFEDLVARHPAIVVHFAHVIAGRIRETDAVLDAFLDEKGPAPDAAERLAGQTAAVVTSRASVLRAWKEFVASHGRELPSLALTSFMLTLAAVRLMAHSLSGERVLFDFLRGAYVTGIVLVFLSTATALVRFRARVQRAIALVQGAAFALILNELSVFLAFDTFYLDMTTPDPDLIFDVEALYRRSESRWGVMLMAAFLLQLALLRPFYRRLAFLVRTRLGAAWR